MYGAFIRLCGKVLTKNPHDVDRRCQNFCVEFQRHCSTGFYVQRIFSQ